MPGSIENQDFVPLGEFKSVSRTAILGQDFRGLNLEPLCQPGDRINAGAAVLRDVRHPSIVLTAPLSGVVYKVEYGARRRLASLQIELDSDPGAMPSIAPPRPGDAAAMRQFMLATGAWCGLRSRPFGNIPEPDSEPVAIVVTAIDNEPNAPPVAAIIELFAAEFRSAITALASLGPAPLYLCHATAQAPSVDESAQIRCKGFAGDYRMGLAGTHINALCPIGFAGKQVWQIAYPEVISLGHLLLHGAPWSERIINFSGDALKRPRLLRVPAGASTRQLLSGELVDDAPVTVINGSAKFGRRQSPTAAFLGAGQRQLTVLRGPELELSQASDAVVIPTEVLESCLPPGIYAAALMRALQICDVDRARELGALELLEDDLSALGRASHAHGDYGQLLRQALDQLEREYQ